MISHLAYPLSAPGPDPSFSGYNVPDVTTIIACATALSGIILVIFLLFWIKDSRRLNHAWYVIPFASGVIAGALLAYPAFFGYFWAVRVGHSAIVFSYAAAWQASRVMCGRKPYVLPVIAMAVSWFLFTLLYDHSATVLLVSQAVYALVIATLSWLSAREFRKVTTPNLPSAVMLFWIFAVYAGINLARTPLGLFLPAPLGPASPTWWSISIFALLVVIHGVLVTTFMIALEREKVAAENYQLALMDPLTNVGNRRALDKRIETLKSDLVDDTLIGCIAFDIDRFKRVNDQYGHDFGDKIIKLAATIACRTIGSENVFRTGGEEFSCVVTGQNRAMLMETAERLRLAFAEHAAEVDGIAIAATISLGASLSTCSKEWENLAKAADKALYEAKCSGRNCCIIAAEEPQKLSGNQTIRTASYETAS
ncbi:diguanylate cyclase [Altererythrobacter indicus]|uniref:diguanylate cyclase n=1 Tax=Altericroceibacterium indicum TaxID=374177 RepID=A0A845A605_9SPHN|nr:GGDEF domain-containing protein [Altericroceibacterium indicum]MXP25782.1 diguanylate cyclase [Altericroceibacterium indicum]